MSNFLTNLKGLQFELETVKKKLKNQNIICKGNLDYQRIQMAISRLKKTIEDQKTTPSENLQKKNKNSSPIKIAGLPKKFQKKYPQKTLKISSPINVVEFPKENKNINLEKKFSPINVVGPSKEILVIDLPITEKNLIDVILSEREELDENLGIHSAKNLSIPFKFAFNTLLINNIIKKL